MSKLFVPWQYQQQSTDPFTDTHSSAAIFLSILSMEILYCQQYAETYPKYSSQNANASGNVKCMRVADAALIKLKKFHFRSFSATNATNLSLLKNLCGSIWSHIPASNCIHVRFVPPRTHGTMDWRNTCEFNMREKNARPRLHLDRRRVCVKCCIR